mgnify:CR=1 FL=1
MKDFFKKHIWDDGDDKKSPPAAGAAPPVAGNAPPQAGVAAPGGVAPSVSTFGVDPAMVADVKKLIERRPTPYTNLRETADAMAEALPDETTRVRAAFAMMKKSGTQAAQVVSSIDLHVRDIEGEKTSFATSAKQAVERKAGGLRAEADQLINANKSDEQSIAQLQQQIQQLQARSLERAATASAKQTEANQAEADIQAKTTQFLAAADTVITDLNMQKTQLSAMLA